MTTSFTKLPIVDLSILSTSDPDVDSLGLLSKQLYDVFATTGFAYLINSPLTFSHDEVFSIARDFFGLDPVEKMKLAKKTFVRQNNNTYRGYFPPQPGQMDNLKEGFEVGPRDIPHRSNHAGARKFDLAESNVWPDVNVFHGGRAKMEKLHAELQSLSSMLLSLLAVSLDKPPDFFSSYLFDSLSTLRLLHYPPQAEAVQDGEIKLCCTPHTDSGIMTLLHQDRTGGLEVLNASGDWIAAPYVSGSIVVNIGDLLAKVSGGRFIATMHRVRVGDRSASERDGFGRFSVPFFFEPGEDCVVKNLDGSNGIAYGEHVRKKMSTWIEFQDSPGFNSPGSLQGRVAVEA